MVKSYELAPKATWNGPSARIFEPARAAESTSSMLGL